MLLTEREFDRFLTQTKAAAAHDARREYEAIPLGERNAADARRCRRLWAAVLERGIRDAVSEPEPPNLDGLTEAGARGVRSRHWAARAGRGPGLARVR